MIDKESIIPRTDPILRIAMYEVYEAKCFYKTERKTHSSLLRGWDVSDKRKGKLPL